MKLSIIILSYKSERFLINCLKRINFNRPYEIIIVDNDHNLLLMEKAGKIANVRILPFKGNLGFASGNNRGIKAARGEYILALNADAFVTKNYIKKLVDFLDQHKDFSSVQGKLLSLKNKKIIDATANCLTWSGFAFAENHLLKDKKPKSAEVFGVCAAAALYRRSSLEKVSNEGEYFDKDFFAYLEDIDLDWRLRLYGFRAYYLDNAIAYHYREATTNHRFRRKQALRNVILMNFKNDSVINLIWKLPFYFILNFIFLFPSNLKDFFSLLPKMRAKRKIISKNKKIKNINKWLKPFPRRHLTKI